MGICIALRLGPRSAQLKHRTAPPPHTQKIDANGCEHAFPLSTAGSGVASYPKPILSNRADHEETLAADS